MAIAHASLSYPTDFRSTALSWLMGLQRVSGIIGPLVVGPILEGEDGATIVFIVCCVSYAILCISLLFTSEPKIDN